MRVIVNKKIAKYQKIIDVLYIVSMVIGVILIVIQFARGWYILEGINKDGFHFHLILLYILGILGIPSISWSINSSSNSAIDSAIAVKIDQIKICDCVTITEHSTLENTRIKILSSRDKVVICLPIILDILYSAIAMIFGIVLFGKYLGSFIVAHFCSYITIIFYALCCTVKRKELSNDLQTYLADKMKELIEKQKAEKIAKDKLVMQRLLDQCGIKFFIKYYDQIKRLPLRDISIEENYSSSETNERLTAARQIIDGSFTELAIDNILCNYSDILTKQELEKATEIKESNGTRKI